MCLIKEGVPLIIFVFLIFGQIAALGEQVVCYRVLPEFVGLPEYGRGFSQPWLMRLDGLPYLTGWEIAANGEGWEGQKSWRRCCFHRLGSIIMSIMRLESNIMIKIIVNDRS